ncbi:bacteriophage Gp15 family protein [Clostridium paraputrificum]|uniref:bacteriophage Gp15 family protein n=1 Tax=Clostridium TaxID=1485 RepID=UPI00232F8E5C|nr:MULTISPECIES: bacteriophage Gp15 family protein [Clostridium]MDB2089449.1 bacteriophage Gp15 family protein [Clostridium paraputrificum]MDB2096385.1 bacteriophage Gp15 family protein [Clostridium paraputrificum]MDU1179945.1 bacteriophage Gp15 family protein [Clostridium sp.]MDU1226888.1 bacteriophage Gp15 family protein [Clostridium sp.]MDU7653074.1 bacteriophage Gp15 family protein [Clostridium sp.]
MNILVDLVPTTVSIDNKEYEINSDFRTSILFELLMQDGTIEEDDKILMALQLYYPDIPENIKKAIEQMLWFYRCGKDVSSSKGNGKSKGVTQIYSFEYDDNYIYSAFLDQYNIDLQDIEYLHWWKFKAMFKALKDDNMIVKIMGYRSMDLSKVKDKEQKAYYKRMQKLYEIPISKDEQNKLDDITIALLSGEDLSKVL